MLGIQLHIVSVVTRQVHEVDSEFEIGFLKYFGATNDFKVLLPRAH